MTISLPSDEILMKYASGSLDPALHMLVDAHLERHPASRATVQPFNRYGGLCLSAAPGVEMAAGSLDRALARIASCGTEAPAPSRVPDVEALDWRWAGPGRGIANIAVPGSRYKAYALRIQPGRAMLQHTHAGQEWTVILQGAYADEGGAFDAGSFIEEDGDTNHRPVATGNEECICLAVMSAPLLAQGIGGVLARWLMR